MFSRTIPNNLLASAYRAENGEPAWKSDDALKVIDWANASGSAVLGVEVWLATTPGPTIPTPYIYSFETERREDEEWNQFVTRANAAASDYVQRFQWDADDKQHQDCEPHFNLTLEQREESVKTRCATKSF